ncbi:hypothetical protein GCM10007972_25700 [Iodidimonas muriae]|uniref:Sulfotransferase family protein n=2 Tax=Iodidimonas muriae TaxID=261467 RepID=A0ABQ2LFX5_9PROT|nr:hypothetical protein JCM17843_30370 [Kordiimonadales bacterium JCM 17843]GGO16530.1 hypothetical protein GCM10007972_25700 [Iodidimonas muriae]
MRTHHNATQKHALYALPDHEVVEVLLPRAVERHVAVEEAARLIRTYTGLVPLAIDPRGEGRVIWGDLGVHPFREWQYIFTIQHLAAQESIGDAFSTPIDILDHEELFADSLYPSGFIHHISRCGSTLTAKALARPNGHMMISQGGPLQRGFWAHITKDWTRPAEPDEKTLRRLRTLVLAMTRPRCGDEHRAFVKFISWNVVYVDLIAAAFPDVPALFLYRDPVEVIASVKRDTTAALLTRGTDQGAFLTGLPREKGAELSDVDYLTACYARYFEVVEDAKCNLSLVNYRDLGPHSFTRVAEQGLDLCLKEDDRLAMLEQFRYHSKDDSNSSTFSDDRAAKQAALSEDERARIEETCADLIARLDHSKRNLFAKNAPFGGDDSQKTFARQHQ